MSESLYQIEENLQILISEIEEQGGEFTEEQAKALEVTQENYRQKINSYCAVIDKYKAYIDSCKNEKKRVNELQKVRENTIARLKNIIIDSLNQFGDTGKSGNKVLELDTRKLFTKTTESIEVDALRSMLLIASFIDYIKELKDEGILETGQDVDITGTLDAINQIIYSNWKEDPNFVYDSCFIPFNINDIDITKVNINIEMNLGNLIKSPEIIDLLVSPYAKVKFDVITSKDELKELMKVKDVTVAEKHYNTSLIMK